MKHKRPIRLITICAAIIGLGIAAWQYYPASTLDQIRKRGYLTVLSENNANAYYIYRDTPMGFEYDLAEAFAAYLGVDIQVKTPGWSRLLDMVNTGQGDIIAAGMTATPARQKQVDFATPYLQVRQQVIIHKHNYAVKTIDDLAGQTIHVREGTTYHQRLEELQAGGIDLNIRLHRNLPTEELIQRVAEKKIDITIADSNIALLTRRYYPDIKIAFPVEKEQSLAWAVARGNTDLLAEINNFFDIIRQDGRFDRIYTRYYSAIDLFDYVDIKRFHRRLDSRLPVYEQIVREEAEKYGFDWRLIAAVIYQESHFDPYATSFTGVRGIMQLTRRTAAEMGISDRLDPIQSIKGGVRYLSLMNARFDDIPDPHTRLLFALASYNIGYGHVRDAQEIAGEMDLPTDKWRSLKETLPLLRNHKYYKNTRYGYARGTEAVQYVKRIMTYYDILKKKAGAAEAGEPAVRESDDPTASGPERETSGYPGGQENERPARI